jgi:hypothetical protein
MCCQPQRLHVDAPTDVPTTPHRLSYRRGLLQNTLCTGEFEQHPLGGGCLTRWRMTTAPACEWQFTAAISQPGTPLSAVCSTRHMVSS